MKHRCKSSSTAKFYPSCLINNPRSKDSIEIQDYTIVLGQLLVTEHSGQIKVGKCTYIGNDSNIWSSNSIVIGDRVFISFGVNIHDYDAHSLSAEKRHKQFKEIFIEGVSGLPDDIKSKPVKIEDDVWIGFNVSILKGVTIGKGAIIGASSVVTHDVEPYTIVAGNPAKNIGFAKS